MAFHFRYIASRVRRRVPPANVLYHRMLVVFDFFKDKIDTKTGVILFHEKNKKKFKSMLDMIRKGYASDPPNMAMYIQKTDNFGRTIVDKDGLTLYRSIRGTSNLESLHQYLTTSFGHTMAGPWYSDILLAVVRHFYNWRMSRKNRPNFPPLMHYDGMMIDRINNLYELIYGYTKYRAWSSFNENLPLQSSYGIVPINNELTSTISYTQDDITNVSSNMLKYLAQRQNAMLPFLPIRGENEKRTIHKKLNEIVANEESLSNQNVYEKLSINWNTHDVSIARKLYPKLPSHFARYVKGWQKNQDRRDAEIASGANRLSAALEHVPANANTQSFQPLPLHQAPCVPLPENRPPINSLVQQAPQGMLLLCQACLNQPVLSTPNTTTHPIQKKKPRTCRVEVDGRKCPIPDRCRGKSNRKNCILYTGGDINKISQRTISNVKVRVCFMCKRAHCPGISKRERCNNKLA